MPSSALVPSSLPTACASARGSRGSGVWWSLPFMTSSVAIFANGASRSHLAREPRRERVGIRGQELSVEVAVGQIAGEDARAVGRLPVEHGLGDVRADAAPQHRRVEAEAREDLRQLADVAELIRHVAEPLRAAERVAAREAEPQVAHQRLARHQPLVRQHGPRADRQSPGAHQLLDPRRAAGRTAR